MDTAPETRIYQGRFGRGGAVSTLAHELGHAHFRHPAGHSPCNELAADRWAARALIDADEYRELERLFPGEDFLISQELGVTQHLLGVWRRHEAWRCAPQLLDVF